MAIFDSARDLGLIPDRPLRGWLYDAATFLATAACCLSLITIGYLVLAP